MNQTELRAAISLASVYVLRMLGLFMVMPVLALLATDFPDYAPWLVGIAIGGYGLTQAILQIPMGILSDKIGRKPVILAGLLLFAAGSAVAAFADSMVMLVIGRLLQGAGAIAGAIMALAGDVSRENQRSKVMAIIGIAIGFSFYLALLVGPVIADLWGLQGIFAVTAILALCSLPLVKWVVPDAQNIAPSGDTLPVLEDIRRLISHPQLMRLNVSVAVLHMMITVLFMQLPTMLNSLGYSLDEHWLIYLPVLLASILGMAVLMGFARKDRQVTTIKISIFCLGVALAGLALADQQFWLLMAFIWLFFTGFNFLEANFPALVSSIAPAGKKGSAMGIYASLQFFGAFAGGLISGVIAEFFAPETVFMLASVTCVIWLLLVRNLITVDVLKRYALDINLTKQTVEDLKAKLTGLEGIKDVTIVPQEEVAYLKVDSRQFDLRAARTVASAE